MRQGDGATLRAHLQRLAAQGKADPEDRLNIEWPAAGRPIWNEYQRISRPPLVGGISSIGSHEILAHQTLYGVRFTPWELEMIEIFDSITIEVMSKKGK